MCDRANEGASCIGEVFEEVNLKRIAGTLGFLIALIWLINVYKWKKQ